MKYLQITSEKLDNFGVYAAKFSSIYINVKQIIEK